MRVCVRERARARVEQREMERESETERLSVRVALICAHFAIIVRNRIVLDAACPACYANSFVMQMVSKFCSQRRIAPFVTAYYSVSWSDPERVTTLSYVPHRERFNSVHVSRVSLL